MRNYAMVSGVFFALLTCAQLLRLILRVPVRAGTIDVPLWASACAALVVGGLAVWAFRVATRRDTPGA